MPKYVIALPLQPSLAIAGSDDKFPVKRIWCVGRNYEEHIKEMGHDTRDPPFFFAKPADAVVDDNATVPYPPLTKDFQHEIELVVAMKSGGRNIKAAEALDHVWGYAVGLDLTRRDLQVAAYVVVVVVGGVHLQLALVIGVSRLPQWRWRVTQLPLVRNKLKRIDEDVLRSCKEVMDQCGAGVNRERLAVNRTVMAVNRSVRFWGEIRVPGDPRRCLRYFPRKDLRHGSRHCGFCTNKT